jgi:hypothetical protein
MLKFHDSYNYGQPLQKKKPVVKALGASRTTGLEIRLGGRLSADGAAVWGNRGRSKVKRINGFTFPDFVVSSA